MVTAPTSAHRRQKGHQMSPDDLAEAVAPHAAALIVAVADADTATISGVLTRLDTQELYALAVVLAANASPDSPLHLTRPGSDDATARFISEAVRCAAREFHTTPGAIRSRSRARNVLDGRTVAITVCRLAGLSSTQIGRALDRDHSTVLYSASRCGENPHLWSAARAIADRLGVARPLDESA